MNRSQQLYAALLLKILENKRQPQAAKGFASGGPSLPRKPVLPLVAASSTATANHPPSPFQVQADGLASMQQQVAANQSRLGPTAYVPDVVKQIAQAAQTRKELEEKALTYADNAALTLPVPYVGETVGVLGAGIGAGIRGGRAVQQARRGVYIGAVGNTTGAVMGHLEVIWPVVPPLARVRLNRKLMPGLSGYGTGYKAGRRLRWVA